MGHFIKDGGFGMFPTLIFGLFLLGIAVRYAVAPERRWVPLLVALGTATLSSGALGFTTGLTVVAHAVERSASVTDNTALLSVVGFGEALNNVVFALGFLVLAATAASIGAFRLTREPLAR